MQPARPWYGWAGLALAGLVGLSALVGVLLPSTYARETSSWAAQGVGQDWVNLVFVAPTLAVAGLWVLRGSRAGRLLLGGALVYCVYSFLFYAFDVHFNRLFLVYCGVLGLSFYALASLVLELVGEDTGRWFEEPIPARLAGGFLIGVGVLFGLLWLSQLVPALLKGTEPPGLAELGLLTNPVHVVDLSLLLPGLILAGTALCRRSSLGYTLGPIMLGFNVLMALAIGGMAVALQARRISEGIGLALVTAGIALASGVLLAGFLLHLRRS